MPETRDIASVVKKIVAGYFDLDASILHDETRFHEDLSGDSLDDIEILMAMEEAFGIEIADGEAEGIATVGAAIALAEAKVGAMKGS